MNRPIKHETLNETLLKDAQPSIDQWMEDPEFREAYEEEGLKIQIAEQIRSRRKIIDPGYPSTDQNLATPRPDHDYSK